MNVIKTVACLNPKLVDHVVVAFEDQKIFIVHNGVMSDLLIRAGKRFKTIAPLSPYPDFIGCEWRGSKTVIDWVRKQFDKNEDLWTPYEVKEELRKSKDVI